MDIYQFAMRMERDGEEYYRRLAAEETVAPGVAKILTMLADEEVKHYEVVERLSRRETDPPLADEEANHLRVMETLVEFVSRPEPGNWLENAEWYHLEEY